MNWMSAKRRSAATWRLFRAAGFPLKEVVGEFGRKTVAHGGRQSRAGPELRLR